MKDARYNACRALFALAFPEKDAAVADALFDRYYPDHVRVICEGGEVVSMLFSIPSPVQLENGTLDARYLYGIATHPDHRGKGLAKQMIAAEAEAHPVFLRPLSPSLFDFYAKAGLSPISPATHMAGDATAPTGQERSLSAAAYLAMRDELTPPPCVRHAPTFLSVFEQSGGFVAYGAQTVALYEKKGDLIRFKEYVGTPDFAPRLAAFLGGSRFELRYCDPNGTPFGVGAGLPPDTAFLAAMD